MSDATPPATRSSRSTRRRAERARRAANLFDLRRIIGGLFLIYGVILVILGLGASDAEIEKAAGWNLNLWVGVAMLITAAIFLAWAFARPLGRGARGRRATRGRPRRGRAGGSETARRRPRRDRDRPRRRFGARREAARAPSRRSRRRPCARRRRRRP